MCSCVCDVWCSCSWTTRGECGFIYENKAARVSFPHEPLIISDPMHSHAFTVTGWWIFCPRFCPSCYLHDILTPETGEVYWGYTAWQDDLRPQKALSCAWLLPERCRFDYRLQIQQTCNDLSCPVLLHYLIYCCLSHEMCFGNKNWLLNT